MNDINSVGKEVGEDGYYHHIPRPCGKCCKPRSAIYGRDNTWFCLPCWILSKLWETREE
jgi:hypothetical protein